MVEVSILKSTRAALGLDPEDKAFDADLLTYINAAIQSVIQVGVGSPIIVEDESTTWDAVTTNKNELGLTKQYVHLRTRILFDSPPPSAIGPITEVMHETLWRLEVEANSLKGGETT